MLPTLRKISVYVAKRKTILRALSKSARAYYIDGSLDGVQNSIMARSRSVAVVLLRQVTLSILVLLFLEVKGKRKSQA